tara:strand:- start:1097 stop:2602 length:1506 start_codon:yes stop_codon:yes gene_type:complete
MKTLFNSIALSFSGGGYRAACFSLGTLSLFDKINLLQNVEALSTVSGGTISGTKYAQSQIEGKSFDVFFKEYYNQLKEDKLLKNAMSHIEGGHVWKQSMNRHKRQNPINAFAIEYNKHLSQHTLGDIQDAIVQKRTHLKRVVFNATDFSSGLQFRFQNIEGTKFRFGNKGAHKYKDLIPKLKLGDILASSSAFPGGFEPISFPHDFVKSKKDSEEIGLMDGGIVDNQGASVFIKNNPEDNPHDLIFICDVASPYMESFKYADKNGATIFITYLSSLPALLLVLFLTILFFKNHWWILYTISIVLESFMFLMQLLFFIASRKLKKATGIEKGLVIPPRRIGLFLLDRMNSVLKMASDVFLKNDRRQNANSIYKDYNRNIVTATIYELRCEEDGKPENEKQWDEIKVHTGEISEAIKKVSLKSSAFGTTLWFSKKDQENNVLDALIACGEYTACYNLIAHLVRYYSDDIKIQYSEAHLLLDKLKLIWKEFMDDPYFLVNYRKK